MEYVIYFPILPKWIFPNLQNEISSFLAYVPLTNAGALVLVIKPTVNLLSNYYYLTKGDNTDDMLYIKLTKIENVGFGLIQAA